MSDGKITISTSLDDKPVKRGIKGMQSQVKNGAKRLQKIGGQMTAFVTAPFLGVGAAAGAAMIKYGEFADQMLDTASKTGMSTDELQRWRQVATDAGVDTEIVSNSLLNLNKQLERGSDLSPRLAKAFETMGTNVDDFKKMDPDQQMRQVVDTMLELEDADRRAFANQMNMAEMLPLISELEGKGMNLDQIMQEIDVPFSNDELNEMNEFRKEWDNLKFTLFNVMGQALQPLFELFNQHKDQIVGMLVPAIQSLADRVIELAQWFMDLSPATQKILGIFTAIAVALPPLISLGASLAIVISSISLPALAVAAAFGALIAIGVALYKNWDTIKDYAIVTWTAIKVFFTKTFEAIKSITSSVWEGIKTFFTTTWDGIKSLFMNRLNFVKSLISTVWNTIKSVTSSVWNGIKSTVTGIWDGLKSSVSSVFNGIKDTITSAWEAISGTTSDIWNGIIDTIKGAINGVIGAINGMLNAISSINISTPTIPSWVPKFGGESMNIGFPDIPNIPSLNCGKTYTPNKVVEGRKEKPSNRLMDLFNNKGKAVTV
ncbi:hypothetical protein SH601_05475 [Gracilibacillus sp. S3-1-1]|uniref:Uncharacterized protein n=1 Tax=Gracilibacillus pellucidus TaxID=3095368 RepID=A0ACC6M3A2_9BACI|nr:hypothetical protein [Gracilibacillus sp. S3-1-1]MDX8045435.1 hypothetical protein [Gracilibacillus sp. S3-1-1]